MKKFFIALFALTTTCTTAMHAQRVTVTLAGNGAAGYNGDALPGPLTTVSSPMDVCRDAAGNLYFTDAVNQRVRKLSARYGTISTIAGGGYVDMDGIAATDALVSPQYLCVDAAGNIYFSSDNRIRKVSAATGLISTIAGNAISGDGGDGGAATAALLNAPKGLCMDAAGNLYIADNGNNRIRKITAATGRISTIGGSGVAGHSGDGGAATSANIFNPTCVAVAPSGDVFFADQSGAYIRRIASGTGIMSLYAGSGGMASGDGGPAAIAGLGSIYGICSDDTGNIFIDDVSCSCREIDATSHIIHTVGGSLVMDGYNGDGGNALNIYFNFPYGLCIDPTGSLYVADYGNQRIRKAIQLTHTPSFAMGTGQTISACSGAAYDLGKQLAITDLDSGQTETWTVVSAPVHGTLSGFPYTALSMGAAGTTTPAGPVYSGTAGYSGDDSFKIQVSDGGLWQVTTIYIKASAATPVSPGGPYTVCMYQSIALAPSVSGGMWTFSNSNANGSGGSSMAYGWAPGADTLTYTVFAGCMQTLTAVITVNEAPDPGSISGAYQVCVGSTVTYTDATGIPGVWSVDTASAGIATIDAATGALHALAGGHPTITYSVAGALCTSAAYAYLTIDTAAAIAPAITGSSTVAVGAGDTLSIAGVPSGYWTISPATGGNIISYDGVFTAGTPGTDTVYYIVTNGCGSDSSMFVINAITTAVPCPDNSFSVMTLSPNPAHRQFSVSIASPMDEPVSIQVLNLLGQVVSEQKGTTNHAQQVMLDVPAGVYVVRAQGVRGAQEGKVVIQ